MKMVDIDGGNLDLLDPVARRVNELRQIHGSVGSGSVVNQDGQDCHCHPRRCG